MTARPTNADWSTFDTAMVAIAKARGEVLFLDRADNEYRVRLVAWRGRCGRLKCRIEHPSGKQATVGTELVRPIPVG